MSGFEVLMWLFMGAAWGWCLRAMGEHPTPKSCDYTAREHRLGRELSRQVDSVYMKMACVGVHENGAGWIIEEHASITIPGKAKLSMTLRGETA